MKVKNILRAIVNVIVKCLVLVKMKGNNPKKLLIVINKNIEMKNVDDPGLKDCAISILISLWNVNVTIFFIFSCNVLLSHLFFGIVIKINNSLIQLEIISDDDGSNEENSEFIIFSFFFYLLLIFYLFLLIMRMN